MINFLTCFTRRSFSSFFRYPAKVFLTAQLYHVTSPSSPFQTLHQLSIAVRKVAIYILLTLLEGSIWSGLLLISNLISYHNIPNLASAFHHIERFTIHKHVWVLPCLKFLVHAVPFWPEMSLLLPQPNPHTVQLTLDTGLSHEPTFCEEFFNSKYFSTTLSWFVEFIDAEDPWIQRADYKVRKSEMNHNYSESTVVTSPS